MAINPNIPLSVQPFQTRSPLESFQRAMSIRDMIAGTQERQQVAKINAFKLKEAEFDLAAKERETQDENDYRNVLRESWKLEADGDIAYDERGYPQFDEGAVAQRLTKLNRPHLISRFKKEQTELLEQGAKARAEQSKANEGIHKRWGDTLAAFQAIPEDVRTEIWPSWLAAKVKAGMIDPEYADMLAKQGYSPELLESEIQANIGQEASNERHLKAAQTRETAAKARAAERALTQPTATGYAPGTLIRITHPDGRVEEQTVPRAPTAAELELNDDIQGAMKANPALSKEQATDIVLKQRYESKRLDLVNAQELATGRKLDNQTKREVQMGILTGPGARAIMNGIRATARGIDQSFRSGTLQETSPYYEKDYKTIVDMLLDDPFETGGFTKDELIKASGGGPKAQTTSSVKTATKAEVEAAAKKAGITFDELKKRIEAAGGKVQ